MESPVPEYSSEVAFRILMEKIKIRDPDIALQIQTIIDQGKDEDLKADSADSKSSRFYRKSVKYSYNEAIKIAIDAIQAFSVEQALYIQSLTNNLSGCSIRQADPNWFKLSSEAQSVVPLEKPPMLFVDLGPDTKIELDPGSAKSFENVPPKLIDEQKQNIAHLRSLTSFEVQ